MSFTGGRGGEQVVITATTHDGLTTIEWTTGA